MILHHTDEWSVPRKELIAVLEGAHIAILTGKALEGRISNLTVWMDAMTVLSWLTNNSICPNQFIRRKFYKLNILHHHFEHVAFKHVQTQVNPADVASHGVNLARCSADSVRLWLNGPPSLCGRAAPSSKGAIHVDLPAVSATLCGDTLALSENFHHYKPSSTVTPC